MKVKNRRIQRAVSRRRCWCSGAVHKNTLLRSRTEIVYGMSKWWFIDNRELKVERHNMPRKTETHQQDNTTPPRSAEEEQLDRLRQEMDDDDGSPPEMWDPEPGESLIAELLRYEERTTKVGPCRVAVVREADSVTSYSACGCLARCCVMNSKSNHHDQVTCWA